MPRILAMFAAVTVAVGADEARRRRIVRTSIDSPLRCGVGGTPGH